MKRRYPVGVWLDLGDLLAGQPPQAWDFVGPAAPLQLVEAFDFALVNRQHELARTLVGNLPLLAVRVQRACALDAEPRLERAGLVVDAGVDDSARAAGLVVPDPLLGLQHAEARPRTPGQELPRHRHAEDAPPDDGQVAFAWGLGVLAIRHQQTRFGGSSPASAESALSATRIAIALRARHVADPMWGSRRHRGAERSSTGRSGSRS